MCALQGYPPDLTRFYAERIKAACDNAEAVPGGPHVAAIVDHAKALGLYAIFGLNELDRGISAVGHRSLLPSGHTRIC